MSKEFLTKKRTLTGLVKWMNGQGFKKQNGKEFTVNDVQKYVSRGYIPEYLGKNRIEKDTSSIDSKLYNVLK